jgi:uncharacterized protein DUF6069
MQATPAAASSAATAQGPASVIKAALMSLVVSLVGNAGLFMLGSSMGAFPADVVMPDGKPLSIAYPMTSTVIGTILATIAFSLMRRFLGAPLKAYRILAGVVLVAAVYAPFTIQHVSTAMGIVFNVMHLVVVASTTWAFTMSKR